MEIPFWPGLSKAALPPVTLVGHPFGSIGRAEHLRTIWRALACNGINAGIYDLTRAETPEPAVQEEFGASVAREIPDGIRIFHLNGEDLAAALPLLEQRHAGYFGRGYNIIYPAWELPRYPAHWARELNRFDEVWTATSFVHDAVRAAVAVPVLHLRNACEPHIRKTLGRSHFSIAEDRYVILVAFDVRSFTSRKNPWAAIEAFRRLVRARPAAPAQLVLKINHSPHDASVLPKLRQSVADLGDRVTLIDAVLSNNEAKNLIRCCDCLLSLHRSEGFGRGPAEAMFFGKPAVATGWSGNMEYMNARNSFPIKFQLIPVKETEYLEPEGQLWAEPDVDHATEVLIQLIDNPARGQATGRRARAHMARNFSDRALGRQYRRRLQAIERRRSLLRALEEAPTTRWGRMQQALIRRMVLPRSS